MSFMAAPQLLKVGFPSSTPDELLAWPPFPLEITDGFPHH